MGFDPYPTYVRNSFQLIELSRISKASLVAVILDQTGMLTEPLWHEQCRTDTDVRYK